MEKIASANREKICPKCGASFGCSTSNCWCAELPPVIELTPGAECYCPTCLKEIIDLKLSPIK